ncbi:hypothetical protein CTI12_AA147860 [Artemisia annua]|uniref:Uncharacterized protein n=1 Tax=Artemisia annua TaxID=35608 RepID=A0A2U1PIF7_ARTAN|nr:hypothetical protein CTI12_AA147860 [Artemisia annua]
MTKGSSTRRRGSCFFSCFGYSGDYIEPLDEVNPESPRRRRWFSKLKFSFKKSDVKTVPVELSKGPRKSGLDDAHVKSCSTWEIQVVEEDDAALTKKGVSMVKEKHNPQGRSQPTPVAGSNTAPDTGLKSDEQNTNSKKFIDSIKVSCPSRRKETKAASARVDSPKKKNVTITQPNASSTLKPRPKVKKRPLSPTAVRGVEGGFMHKKTPSSGEFDSIVGMSIILVTLLIMVLWGKLCAILCTSAWFFVAPRLGGPEGHSAIAMAEKRRLESGDDMETESVEYKKKVVMEGLLKRNHRNISDV